MIEASYAKFTTSIILERAIARIGEIMNRRAEIRKKEIDRVVQQRAEHNSRDPGILERLFSPIYKRKMISTDWCDVARDLHSWGGLNWVNDCHKKKQESIHRIIKMCEITTGDEVYLCDLHVDALYGNLT